MYHGAPRRRFFFLIFISIIIYIFISRSFISTVLMYLFITWHVPLHAHWSVCLRLSGFIHIWSRLFDISNMQSLEDYIYCFFFRLTFIHSGGFFLMYLFVYNSKLIVLFSLQSDGHILGNISLYNNSSQTIICIKITQGTYWNTGHNSIVLGWGLRAWVSTLLPDDNIAVCP